jgi:hypothetical protein
VTSNPNAAEAGVAVSASVAATPSARFVAIAATRLP